MKASALLFREPKGYWAQKNAAAKSARQAKRNAAPGAVDPNAGAESSVSPVLIVGVVVVGVLAFVLMRKKKKP